MYERRYELLKNLVDDINPHAFENLWVELAIEFQVICHSLFDCYYSKIKSMKKLPADSMFENMNKFGKEAIVIAERIVLLLVKKEEKFEYTQVVINKRLSIGQIYTWLYFKEISDRIAAYRQALENYKLLKIFLDEYQSKLEMPANIAEQYKLTVEMIDLMPIKMAKLQAVVSN